MVFNHQKMRIVLSILLSLSPFMAVASTHAAQLDSVYVRLDRLTEGVTSNDFLVAVNPNGINNNIGKVILRFDDAFTLAASADCSANVSIQASQMPSGVVPFTGTPTCTSSNTNGAKDIVIGGLTAGSENTWGMYVSNLVTNPSTAGTSAEYEVRVTTQTSASAPLDESYIATYILDTAQAQYDQITVSASVDESFQFYLSSNTSAMGELPSGNGASISGAGVAATITTNAGNGWVTFLKGSDGDLDGRADLYSTSKSKALNTYGSSTDNTPSDLSGMDGNTEAYLVDVDLTTDADDPIAPNDRDGTVTIAPEYAGSSVTQGGTIAAIFEKVASADGPTGGDVITLIPRGKSSAYTEAATDYTSTLTVVGAGNF